MLEETHTLTKGGSDINCHLRQQRGNLSPIRRPLGERFEGKSALKVRSVGSVTPRQLYVGTTLTFRAVPHLSLPFPNRVTSRARLSRDYPLESEGGQD